MLELIDKKDFKTIYELGAGWGHLVFSLARAFPHTTIVAIEKSWVPWMWLWVLQKCWFRYPNLLIKNKNFFHLSLEEASLTICYLSPKHMSQLEKKFTSELHKGAWVISHTFALPHYHPLQVEICEDLFRTPIYIYQI